MDQEQLLLRLQGDLDAVVMQIGEADYGCEERPEGEPDRVFLRILTHRGQVCREVPEPLLERLGLEEGTAFRLKDLS
ncbi:hypothetical protein KQI82_11840 [Oscillibacter sp. MSJ-2]|uniref:Uncharacterized protein n=1 Tax=Dysosmobacter acutus TaxID=2841504 RepID=A0ABS6FBG4_9FIRM|nr:hypothetical protein [Dysosmobacter acutus]MBU5627601.1 hypothetical protein [Dysosmobacter acutus]